MVKHAPVGSHVLKIEVKDTCGKNKIDELTVEITDDSPVSHVSRLHRIIQLRGDTFFGCGIRGS